jgi:hypothetical protein
VGELAGAPAATSATTGHRSPGEERHRRSRPWRVESGRRGGVTTTMRP